MIMYMQLNRKTFWQIYTHTYLNKYVCTHTQTCVWENKSIILFSTICIAINQANQPFLSIVITLQDYTELNNLCCSQAY